jgi:zinc protease
MNLLGLERARVSLARGAARSYGGALCRCWMSAFVLLACLSGARAEGRSAPSGARAESRAEKGAPPQKRAAPSPFAKPVQVSRLENGLTVVSVPWQSPGIVAYFTLVRVGSRDEVEKGHSGFAHLFEHMMFRGTKRFPKDVYEAKVQDLGADNNAYTSQDFTLYTLTGPRASLSEIAELEADRFQNLTYDEASFRTETGAVLGEYNKSAASPMTKLWETLSELAFGAHTYGHTTIGYLADVLAMPDKFVYSQAFFRRFYTPDNSTVIVAGDVEHQEVLALVQKHYGGWTGQRDQPLIPAEPEPSAGKARHLEWEGIASPQLLLGYRAPAFEGSGSAELRQKQLRETAALEVVHGLCFAEAAPLYQALVVSEQRVLDLSGWAGNFSRDPGLFVVHAELTESATFEEIEARVQAAFDAIARGEGKERVDDVRSHLAYGFPMRMETASDAADALAQFMALTGREQTLTEYLSALSEVTAEDVAKAAAKYLVPTRRIAVTLAPRAKQARNP